MKIDEEWEKYAEQLFLLTAKPMLYCANISEDDIKNPDANPYVRELKAYAAKEKAEVITICARIEEEIAQLDDSEKKAFLSELGIGESGLIV